MARSAQHAYVVSSWVSGMLRLWRRGAAPVLDRSVLFNSAIFVFLYLPIVWIGYLVALRSPWARAGIAWLGVASIVFYGYWNPAFVPLLAVSILFNYGAGRLLDPKAWSASARSRKAALAGAITVNLAALAWYKYAGLLSSSFGAISGLDVPVIDVVLPI